MAIVSIPTSVAGVTLPGRIGTTASGPLKSLYQGTGVQTLKYPADLATDPTKTHYVMFSIKDVIPAGWVASEGQTSIGVGGTVNLVKGFTKLAGNELKASSAVGAQLAGSINGFVESAAQTLSDIGNYFTQGIAIDSKKNSSTAIVSLYMPDSVVANYDSNYTELSLTHDLGMLGTLRQIDQLAGKLNFNSMTDLKKSIGQLASSDPTVVKLITDLLGTKAIGQGQELFLRGIGYAINPQVQMIYKGISLRSFSLSFTLTPKTAQESEEIKKIVETFKFYAAPTLEASATTSTNSMFLIPPSIFNVYFMISGAENRYLPRYGDCVLKNIDVNYTPNGWASYDSGAPVQTSLTLQFEEIEAIDRGKLKSGAQSSSGGLR
jgi:Tail-tube assembly protein